GVDFTQDTVWLLAARVGELAVRLPQFEEQLNLPASPRQDQGIVERELVRRSRGDIRIPVRQEQTRAGGCLPLSSGVFGDRLPAPGGGLGRDPGGEQTAGDPGLCSQLDGQ